MPAFFLYARKSTDEEDRQVLSLDSQIHELREYAQREGLTILEEFVEAKTAKEPGRPIFNLMMEQIEAGKAQGVLAWHPDRLARNSVDGGRIIYLLDTGKLTDLRFPTYRFDNGAQGKFVLSIAFGQSKLYVDNLSDNTKRGLREKLRRGEWPAWAPLGYLNELRTHTVVPDPARSLIVKKLFELYAEGDCSLEELLRTARRLGLTGKLGKPVQKSLLAWTLRNPFYYGVMRYKGELYEGSHPPLISKKLFDRVQEVLVQQTKPQKRGRIKHAFVGLIRCVECGCMISAELQKGHLYYRCTKKKGRCTQKFLREEALLAQVKQAILKVAIDPETKAKMLNRLEAQAAEASNASTSRSRQIAAAIKLCDQKMERLLDLFIGRSIEPEEYQRKKAKLLGEKVALKEKLAQIERGRVGWLEPVKNVLMTCGEASSVVAQANPAAQRAFLKTVGSNFFLKDRTLLLAYRSPYSLVAKTAPRKEWLPELDNRQNLQAQGADWAGSPRGTLPPPKQEATGCHNMRVRPIRERPSAKGVGRERLTPSIHVAQRNSPTAPGGRTRAVHYHHASLLKNPLEWRARETKVSRGASSREYGQIPQPHILPV